MIPSSIFPQKVDFHSEDQIIGSLAQEQVVG